MYLVAKGVILELWSSLLARMSRGIALLVLMIAGLLLALGGAATAVPALDVINQFAGHLIGLAVAAMLALIVGRRHMVVLSLGVFTTLAAHSLIALLSAGPAVMPASASQPDERAWRVVALNAWHHNARPELLVAFLRTERADVVTIAEFGPNKLELLHELEAVYPYRASCAEHWGCAMVLLSRHPISASGVVGTSGFGPLPRVWARFGEGASSLTVIGVHVVKPIDGPQLHAQQLDELVQTVRRAPGAVIAAGDFNDTPWSHTFARFRNQSGLTHLGGLLPSFPAGPKGLPQLAIDHVFVSAGITSTAVGLGPEVGSDHLPLIATIKLPQSVVVPRAVTASPPLAMKN
jgi:endonuclease/exonuclease/phosphatase (EEP) superfamily protein YafD